MADRSIFCCVCGCSLGVIRDARLRKDIDYICGQHKPTPKNNMKEESNPFGDIFGDLLSGKHKPWYD